MASGDAPPLCEHRPARVNPDASLFVGRRVLAPAIAAVGRHAGVRPAGLLDSAPRHGAGSRAGAPSRSRSHSRSGPDHSDGRCAPARRSARTRTIGAIRHSPPHSTSRQTLDNAAQRRHKGTATLPMRHSQEEGPGFCQEFARAFVFLGNPPSIAQPSLASHTGRHSRHNESFTRRRRSPSLKRIHDTRTHPTAAPARAGTGSMAGCPKSQRITRIYIAVNRRSNWPGAHPPLQPFLIGARVGSHNRPACSGIRPAALPV